VALRLDAVPLGRKTLNGPEHQIPNEGTALFLRVLADRVMSERLSTGIRILDATDFKAWLIELAERAEATGPVEGILVESETRRE
jgi:hypothetical protein